MLEIGWQLLSTRRLLAEVIKLFQIRNGDSPDYLAQIFRQFIPSGGVNIIGLSTGKFAIPQCRTALYKKSFVCSGISLWIHLDDNFRQAKTLNIFRSMLKKVYGAKAKLFNLNTNQKTQIIFTQLRVGFSDLNSHLSHKGCIDDPRCSCGAINEDTRHFLLRCPL